MNAQRNLIMGLLLMVACSGSDERARTQEEFCQDWAVAACSKEVLDVCQANDAADCHDSQEAFCRDLVPEDFSDESGDDCIDAVKEAYKDADLEDEELATVLKLGPPCNELLTGLQDEGETCTADTDCDASLGLLCVRKSTSEEGSCEFPEQVSGGRNCEAAQKTCELGFYCNGENCIEARSLGRACTIQEECGQDGFCSSEGECTARLGIDEVCSADHECSTGICYDYDGAQVCTDRIRLGRSDPLCENLR